MQIKRYWSYVVLAISCLKNIALSLAEKHLIPQPPYHAWLTIHAAQTATVARPDLRGWSFIGNEATYTMLVQALGDKLAPPSPWRVPHG